MNLNIYPGTPFQDSGPPVCMAKLIMLRHKVRNQSYIRHSKDTDITPRCISIIPENEGASHIRAKQHDHAIFPPNQELRGYDSESSLESNIINPIPCICHFLGRFLLSHLTHLLARRCTFVNF